jgi:hypothetical protein
MGLLSGKVGVFFVFHGADAHHPGHDDPRVSDVFSFVHGHAVGACDPSSSFGFLTCCDCHCAWKTRYRYGCHHRCGCDSFF